MHASILTLAAAFALNINQAFAVGKFKRNRHAIHLAGKQGLTLPKVAPIVAILILSNWNKVVSKNAKMQCKPKSTRTSASANARSSCYKKSAVQQPSANYPQSQRSSELAVKLKKDSSQKTTNLEAIFTLIWGWKLRQGAIVPTWRRALMTRIASLRRGIFGNVAMLQRLLGYSQTTVLDLLCLVLCSRQGRLHTSPV